MDIQTFCQQRQTLLSEFICNINTSMAPAHQCLQYIKEIKARHTPQDAVSKRSTNRQNGNMPTVSILDK